MPPDPADGPDDAGTAVLSSSSPARSWLAWLAPSIVGLVSLLVYLRTLLPGIAFGDWGEMQTVSHVLGVAHPTGYPTYVLLGWLAQLVPIGSVAFRLNLLSAVLVAGALATVCAIAGRLGVRPILAIAGGARAWARSGPSGRQPPSPRSTRSICSCAHCSSIGPSSGPARRRPRRPRARGPARRSRARQPPAHRCSWRRSSSVFVAWVGRRELLARPWIVVPGLLAVLGRTVGLRLHPARGERVRRRSRTTTRRRSTGSGGWSAGASSADQFDFLAAKGPGVFIESLGALRDLALARGDGGLPGPRPDRDRVLLVPPDGIRARSVSRSSSAARTSGRTTSASSTTCSCRG